MASQSPIGLRSWAPNATVFVSSAAIMLLQLVAGRLVAQYLGQSLYTWTNLIGVTLLGIALGNYAGGRLADRAPGARTLGALLLLCAVAAASTVGLNHLAGHLGWLRALPWPGRIFTHVLLVFTPVFACLGTVSPVITRRALRLHGAPGAAVGGIYAWSIAGSLAGTFATGFALLALAGATRLAFASAGVLGLLGAAYLVLGRDGDGAGAEAPAARPGAPGAARGLAVVLACAALAGAGVMVLELAAGRVLARTYGSSLYTWTGIIGVILGGLSAGGYAGGRLADRRPARPLLAALFMLASIACAASPLCNELLRAYPVLWGFPWPVQIVLHCAALYLLPAFLLGAASPVLARWGLEGGLAAGRTVGLVYAAGSAGSIAGTYLAGYWLLAALGPTATVVALFAVLAALALAFAPRRRTVQAWAAAAAALTLCAAAPWPALHGPALQLALRPWQQPNAYHTGESQYAFIGVYGMDAARPGLRAFVIDKLVHSKADLEHPETLHYPYEHIYSGVLERLHPDAAPVRAMVIGGGGYAFPRYLEVTRPGSDIEAIEIDPAVTEAAHAAFGLPRDTAIRIVHMDGRNRIEDLAAARARGEGAPLDVVFGDSINDFSVPFHLVTREFNERLAGLLDDDGVYMLNMIDRFDAGRFLGAVVATCRTVFPHVYVFSATAFRDQRDTFVAVCSKRPLDLDGVPAAINARHAGSAVTRLGDAELEALEARRGGILLTDDYAPVDNLLAAVVRQTDDVRVRRIERGDALLGRGRPAEALAEAERVIAEDPRNANALVLMGLARRALGDTAGAAAALARATAAAPADYRAFFELGLVLRSAGRPAEAAAALEACIARAPQYAEAHGALGAARFDLGELAAAEAALGRALALGGDRPATLANLAAVRFKGGDAAGAAEALERAAALAPQDGALAAQLAQACWRAQRFDAALEHARRAQSLGAPLPAGFLDTVQRDRAAAGTPAGG